MDRDEGYEARGEERPNDGPTGEPAGEPGGAEPDGITLDESVSASFFYEVMRDLSDTNFARGWGDPTMYRDFLAWCESSPDADEIIARFSPQIPSLLVDPEANVRLVSMQARVAAVLMRELLDAYEQSRIEEFLARGHAPE